MLQLRCRPRDRLVFADGVIEKLHVPAQVASAGVLKRAIRVPILLQSSWNRVSWTKLSALSAWMSLHKLDQDRLLFTVLQGVHEQAKWVASDASTTSKWRYTFLGKLVCCDAFC